jgi:DNA-binding FrmR family transcriptional regulator
MPKRSGSKAVKVINAENSALAAGGEGPVSGMHGDLKPVGPGGNALAVDRDVKTGNLHRLKRIEGQIRGLQNMVRQERYCADIFIQISAVQKSLSSIRRKLLSNHLKHCLTHAIRAGGNQADQAREEILRLLSQIDR